MDQPTLTDYAHLIITLFDKFVQTNPVVLKYQNLCTYKYREMIVFFMLMQFRDTYEFKAQHRWLKTHPEMRVRLKFKTVPHRTTLSRQYEKLAEVLVEFTVFVGQEVEDLDEAFSNHRLAEDKSLFEANGLVWHQSDCQEGRILNKLRNLDTDATCGKVAIRVGFMDMAITFAEDAFPKMVQVEMVSVADGNVLDRKTAYALNHLCLASLTADDRFTKAMRIRHWIGQGSLLLTPVLPVLRWVRGRYAQAYYQLLTAPDIQERFKKRKTSVEPLFDLIAKVIGTTGQQNSYRCKNL